jgi:hypothetical protein
LPAGTFPEHFVRLKNSAPGNAKRYRVWRDLRTACYFRVVQLAHLQSLLAHGFPHDGWQQHLCSALLQLHFEQLQVLQPAHNNDALNTSAATRTPIVFMVTPFISVSLRPKLLSGVQSFAGCIRIVHAPENCF